MRYRALPVFVSMFSSLAFADESPGPAITMAAFGERCCNPKQTYGDTWDTAWLADGRLLVITPWETPSTVTFAIL